MTYDNNFSLNFSVTLSVGGACISMETGLLNFHDEETFATSMYDQVIEMPCFILCKHTIVVDYFQN